MQRKDFNNSHVLWHYDRAREATNNLMFMFASMAPTEDKGRVIQDSLRDSMGWPPEVKNFYDYRMMFGGVYERLFHFCIISLCSDIEVFFKETCDKYGYARNKGNGFFQRFDEVISELTIAGFDFSPIQASIDQLRLAFQIRHIGIHNMGIVDQSFVNKTGEGEIGKVYPIDQVTYRRMFVAYEALLKFFDENLPRLPS
ncbi:hypothetical protein KAF81_32745 [Pseudomonas aeruginosa]|uniref:hypothetical protein n=1 Tax=Pseudomonas aeruginosa TaxID=287 RepID=UPI001B393F68|nr:hypothetical protein [Pseudomonas aeruginosa]MBP8322413.1 hypothetical protein [Pseudomonas aeruginosa]